MKYDITQQDLKIMEHDMATNRVLKHLKKASFYKFTVGDVLIREDNYSGDPSQWKLRTAECGLPLKYVYIYENELGIGYVRRLSVNGTKFVDSPICVVEFDPDNTRFLLDPEYADHLLLSDGDFDAKSRYAELKKKREQINRKNKKLAKTFSSTQEAITWMLTLKRGDCFWYGYSLRGIRKDPYYVIDMNFSINTQHGNYIVVGDSPQKANGWSLTPASITRYYIFMQKPHFMDEILG